MSASTPPPPQQWPLRPDSPRPSRDWAAEFLDLKRTPAHGNITGLSVALADWLGIDVLLVRCLFVLTGLCSGIGVLAYLTGWILTRNATTGMAPLDHVGRRWRNAPPKVVVSWALAFGILGSLLFGTVTGVGWLPVAMIAVTAWAGTQGRLRRGGTPRRVTTRYWSPTPAPVKAHDRAAVAITLGTLLLAAGAAFATTVWFPDKVVLPLAAALGMIGLGLLVLARRGRGLGLIIPGVIVAVAMAAAMIALPPRGSDAIHYLASDQLGDVTLYDSQQSLDIGAVPITEDDQWQIDLRDSRLGLTLAADQNVIIEFNYSDSTAMLPIGFYNGSGQVTYHQIIDETQPTLTIVISAHDSQLWVMP